MSIIVQKYGGSSLSNIDKINKIADYIIEKKEKGLNLIVVASAMGNTTDELLNMAYDISNNPAKREIDVLISSGEQISISLLSIALREKGYESVSLTGFQAGIKTKGIHTKNKIKKIETEKINKYLDDNKIVIVAGFQGINNNGDITTLGRGGSDTSAVALAASFNAKCEIYTDVQGIFSVDPEYYSNANKLDLISYEEMLEMSSLGANVLETRAVDLAQKYNIEIYLAASHKNKKGTYIRESESKMEQKSVTGITVNEDVLMLSVNHIPYKPENISLIFKKLAAKDINIDMISQTPPENENVNISFTTSKEDLTKAKKTLKEFETEFDNLEIVIDSSVVKISVIGIGMRQQSGVAAKIFDIFAQNEIKFKQVTTSEISISYTINANDRKKAVKKIAENYNL
ncbi:MAG: aspartate kinase [Bacillota bacterium]